LWAPPALCSGRSRGARARDCTLRHGGRSGRMAGAAVPARGLLLIHWCRGSGMPAAFDGASSVMKTVHYMHHWLPRVRPCLLGGDGEARNRRAGRQRSSILYDTFIRAYWAPLPYLRHRPGTRAYLKNSSRTGVLSVARGSSARGLISVGSGLAVYVGVRSPPRALDFARVTSPSFQ